MQGNIKIYEKNLLNRGLDTEYLEISMEDILANHKISGHRRIKMQYIGIIFYKMENSK